MSRPIHTFPIAVVLTVGCLSSDCATLAQPDPRSPRARITSSGGAEDTTERPSPDSKLAGADELVRQVDLLATQVEELLGRHVEQTQRIEAVLSALRALQKNVRASPERQRTAREPSIAWVEDDEAGTAKIVVTARGTTCELRFVRVDPGTCTVGIDPTDNRLEPAQTVLNSMSPAGALSSPLVPVTISDGFYIGATEVSDLAYRVVMGIEKPSRSWSNRSYAEHLGALDDLESARDDEPARFVNWTDAYEFTRRLSDSWKLYRRDDTTSLTVRLPTEVEWEYAAVSGSEPSRLFPWGDDFDVADTMANLVRGKRGTYDFERDRTDSGIANLAGGVAEWTWDTWSDNRWKQVGGGGITHDPSSEKAHSESSLMCVRGGHVATKNPWQFQCSFRTSMPATAREATLGFRLVAIVKRPPPVER